MCTKEEYHTDTTTSLQILQINRQKSEEVVCAEIENQQADWKTDRDGAAWMTKLRTAVKNCITIQLLTSSKNVSA